MTARMLILSACLAGTGVWLRQVWEPRPVLLRESLATFPTMMAGWTLARSAPLNERIRLELGVDQYVNRLYANGGGRPLGLYVGYYEQQRQGDSIHSPQNCLPGTGWRPVGSGRFRFAAGGRPPIEVNRYLVQKGLDRQLVFYWYQSHGRVVASEYVAKAYALWDALRLNRTDGAIVRVAVPLQDASAAAEAEGEALAREFVGVLCLVLDRYLPS